MADKPGKKKGSTKTGGRDFKPGNPGGPGRPKLMPELKSIPHLKADECRRIIAKFSRMTLAEVQEFSERSDVPMIQLVVAKIYLKAAQDGDQSRLNFVFDRSIGKVQDKIEVTLPQPYVIKRPSTGEEVVVGATQGDDSDGDNC